jgi:uncharacterized protein
VKKLTLACSLVITLVNTSMIFAQSAPDPTGCWKGQLDVGVMKLTLVFNIARNEEGNLTATMDSPDQGAMGLPVSEVSFEDGTLVLTSAAVRGEFTGQLTADGNSLEGSWSQGGTDLLLVLERSEKIEGLHRPQEPKPPFPYEVEELTYPNTEAGIELAGTLTFPSTGGPFPSVVMVSGSGPQNRDEELMGHKPFAVIADHLTRQGIAVLRFDDRGVGGSTGKHGTATSVDFASDALAGVQFLKTRDEIDPRKIGLIGHSEGGLIAPIAAVESDDLAFIVLLAGTGLIGEEILLLQTELIAKVMGVSDEEIQENLMSQRKMFKVVKEVDDPKEAQGQLESYFDRLISGMTEEQRAKAGITGNPEAWEKVNIDRLVSPWMRYFMTYDPATSLSQVEIPVLAINGENDLQVPSKENLKAISAALEVAKNPDFTVKELPGLNHLFQQSETGSPAEYGKIEETFSPVALELISAWILERFGS